ncbi:MAG: tripartite tricarboxylate transporter TctB family protein [Neomegalonema sp.]|nr:tripartite tricarboxylate transporter TctB family protein [Neomegalonema sp.]
MSIENEQHSGSSDATPGGYENKRRPGEIVFTLVLLAASIGLLWNAYGISGFEKLSAPGTVPMAATGVMVLSVLIILARTVQLKRVMSERLGKHILPWVVVIFVLMLGGIASLLEPLGFVPTAALFLIAGVKILARRGWGFTFAVSLGSLLLIWLIFRVVFTVLMPEGVFPEAEIVQFFRDLTKSGGK